jgi:hypothetical protein
MSPPHPKIYHITHVENLPSIVEEDALLSDARMVARGGPSATIGMGHIKRRRLEKLEVRCHPGTLVGEYVPFYFCPRSVMLYLLHRGDSPELTHKAGQRPIVHLEADLEEVLEWADQARCRWAFSLSNAGAFYTHFCNRTNDLDRINWRAVAATDWRAPEIKEGKQAEFLVYGSFPWSLVSRIGVISMEMRNKAVAAIAGAVHQPRVELQPTWYY